MSGLLVLSFQLPLSSVELWASLGDFLGCWKPHLSSPSQSCDPCLSHDFLNLPTCVFPGWSCLERGCLSPRWDACLLTLCLPPTDRGTIHKVVESGEWDERNRAFNIVEIQPFRHAAAIQDMSLDPDRVSLPMPSPVL